jgi:ribose 5-phosphate isomerase A
MDLKEMAARQALEYVQSDMALGLGSGSTSVRFVDLLGRHIRDGVLHGITGVPTSEAVARRAERAGIRLTTLDECPRLDLAVDGADEVDPDLGLIKGLGGALLREKIVVVHAARFLVIVDESKLVPRLGMRGPLPVEIARFGAQAHIGWLAGLGCRAELRCDPDGSPFVSDNGNYLVHCTFSGGILEPHALACLLAERPGVLEHGLFLDMATAVIVAGTAGVRLLERRPEAEAE